MFHRKLRNMVEMIPPWETNEIVWNDPLGAYSIARLASQWDYCLEGYFLAHCLGTKDFGRFEIAHRAYSLRDVLGFPHATILCRRLGFVSDYGQSADLGTQEPFFPEGKKVGGLVVLQVRGRLDHLAALPYHKMVRDWYEQAGGDLSEVDQSLMDYYCSKHSVADRDWKYHYEYQLDESVNHFQWAYHNERLRREYSPR